MNIGERIYELRRKNSMSQEDLAEKMNVSRQSISKWESSQSVPEVEKIIQLSNILNVSTDWILKCENSKKTNKSIKQEQFKIGSDSVNCTELYRICNRSFYTF